jgi:hypothetical protein
LSSPTPPTQAGVQAAEDAPSGQLPSEVATSLAAGPALRQQQDELFALLATDEGDVRELVDAQLARPGTASVSGASSVSGAGEMDNLGGGGGGGEEGGKRPYMTGRLNSERLLAECGTLESKNVTHVEELMPRLRTLDEEIRSVQKVAADAKHQASVKLFHRLREVSMLQSQISEMRNKLHLYASLLNRVSQYCGQLQLMKKLPATYFACLDEIVRRKREASEASAQVLSAAEAVASAREAEVARRDAFMREHGAQLPRGLAALSSLLQERPLIVEISSSAASDERMLRLSTALENSSALSHRFAAGAAQPTEGRGPTEEEGEGGGDEGGRASGAPPLSSVGSSPDNKDDEEEGTTDAAGGGGGGGGGVEGGSAAGKPRVVVPSEEATVEGADGGGGAARVDAEDAGGGVPSGSPSEPTSAGKEEGGGSGTAPAAAPGAAPPAPGVAPTEGATGEAVGGDCTHRRVPSSGLTEVLQVAPRAAHAVPPPTPADSPNSERPPLFGRSHSAQAAIDSVGLPGASALWTKRGDGSGRLGEGIDGIGGGVPSIPRRTASHSSITKDAPAVGRMLTAPGRQTGLPALQSGLSAALEALGTPLDGVPVEVATKLQQQLEQQALSHAAHRSTLEVQLARQQEEIESLRMQLAATLAPPPPPSSSSSAAVTTPETGSSSTSGTPTAAAAAAAAAAGTADGPTDGGEYASIEGAKALAPSPSPLVTLDQQLSDSRLGLPSGGLESSSALRGELQRLEESHSQLHAAQEVLLSSVRVAMKCLPPPKGGAGGGSGSASASCGAHSELSTLYSSGVLLGASSRAATPTVVEGAAATPSVAGGGTSAGGATAAGGAGGMPLASEMMSVGGGSCCSLAPDSPGSDPLSSSANAALGGVRAIASDLCSSARQAAHANARLGHAMAKAQAELARVPRRLAYRAADVNARMLFIAQPKANAANCKTGVAFGALMLPTLRGGLPTHWLSNESVESLRRWCIDEGSPLESLRAVVGKVVHVSDPIEVPEGATSPADNPFSLAAGDTYHIVMAEMVLKHRWLVL